MGAPIRAMDFCIRTWPPETRLVALITGNFDDSQSTGDVWVVAGYVGYANQWEHFERLWTEALARHGVPYFHMKEMSDPDGPFAKWQPPQDHQDEIKAFFQDLTAVIVKCGLTMIGSGVWLPDLAEFNAANGLALEPYPLAAYACMLQVAKVYDLNPVMAVFDHVEKVDDKLRKARVYADSDPRFYPDSACDSVAATGLPKTVTARDVPAMQAADFIAWEKRKALFNMREWQYSTDRPRGERHEQWQHYVEWIRERVGEGSIIRKSFAAVITNDRNHSVIWDRSQLDLAQRVRSGIWTLEDAARRA